MGCFGKKPRTYHCKIILLDETDIVHDIQDGTLGKDLMDLVFQHLNLLETAYFGLRYLNKSGESRWLDPVKKVYKQLQGTSPFTVYFGVKFYASDPCKLVEEITRYQFFLQTKQDILEGRLPVDFNLAAELFALSLQSELGDYDVRRHIGRYVSEFRFLPTQTPELEEKVKEIHKKLSGQVPSTVEMTFLDRIKWLDMYGVDMHSVMGEDNVEFFLCLTPSGLFVMKNKVKVNNYFWPRVTKVFFKGRYFMLCVKDKNNDESTIGFELSSKESCKYLWKCCVEHHAFFRLTQVKELPGHSVRIFSLGSKHRYSGRTEQQAKQDINRIKRQPPTVVRVPSRRYQKAPEHINVIQVEIKEDVKSVNLSDSEKKDDAVESPLYRSVSTPAALSSVDSTNNNLSPAPWEDSNQRGLFSSQLSLQSANSSLRKSGHRTHSYKRSSSVDSESSCNYKRKRHHRSRKHSDNDSDVSKSSRGSRGSKSSRSCNHHRSHSQDSGSESGSNRQRRSRKHGSRKSSHKDGLVESESQWRMVQKQLHDKKNMRPQSATVRDLSNKKSGYMNSGIDTESEATLVHRKKHRRHSRSRSRSPDTKPVIPEEVKKHIEYKLIDDSNMTEEEKKDIKYTKIETDDKVYKIHYSPATGKPRVKVAKIVTKEKHISNGTVDQTKGSSKESPDMSKTNQDKKSEENPEAFVSSPRRNFEMRTEL